jgi:predicted nucleic acid-binding protein
VAEHLTLEQVLRAGRLVLFDTSVFFDAYLQEDTHGLAVSELIDREIDGARRFTTELVLWEFLHWTDENKKEMVSVDERDHRLTWFNLKAFKIRQNPPSKYVDRFKELVRLPQAGATAVDSALAVYCISSMGDRRGTFAIATADGSDFCWHHEIVVITDFFRGKRCP